MRNEQSAIDSRTVIGAERAKGEGAMAKSSAASRTEADEEGTTHLKSNQVAMSVAGVIEYTVTEVKGKRQHRWKQGNYTDVPIVGCPPSASHVGIIPIPPPWNRDPVDFAPFLPPANDELPEALRLPPSDPVDFFFLFTPALLRYWPPAPAPPPRPNRRPPRSPLKAEDRPSPAAFFGPGALLAEKVWN